MTDNVDSPTSVPFEGPEKLLELWFAPFPSALPDFSTATHGRFGLRKVRRALWEEMLAIVKCQVLSVVEGDEIDAYLLSESSLFVAPHRLILKTCGTTLNLLGLPRILEIAQTYASLPSVYRCFYSRKSFMFPERQLGPHRDWGEEVKFLDNIFPNGSAYTVGKMNGDHWLLYITTPDGKTPTTPIRHHHTLPPPPPKIVNGHVNGHAPIHHEHRNGHANGHHGTAAAGSVKCAHNGRSNGHDGHVSDYHYASSDGTSDEDIHEKHPHHTKGLPYGYSNGHAASHVHAAHSGFVEEYDEYFSDGSDDEFLDCHEEIDEHIYHPSNGSLGGIHREDVEQVATHIHSLNGAAANGAANGIHAVPLPSAHPHDYTIEILMTHLAPEARHSFYSPPFPNEDEAPAKHAQELSSTIGISDIFPRHLTTLDAYSFSPCGYSSNALLKFGETRTEVGGEGYYTIHVTPEEGWSYASFECNVPLPTESTTGHGSIPDLQTLIRRVVNIFKPGTITLTLFVSVEDNTLAEEEEGESAVEAAQRAFKAALTTDPSRVGKGGPGPYRRTDKINYEFGGYDLAFASFVVRNPL
ncbi:hypothetical protein JAAARDRAFT_35268 [Jaapia argillacea MUCL 33604]|uniref:Uncharacterized protein n=1 Tax=Jaapia argillacea MUCL 33604 TaxID=933084 RepID=A0A067PUM8_9AGAM|nr:hypothetical protein JAAARDRAFT_35268 [Jaapia argillacea MUCL 33604]